MTPMRWKAVVASAAVLLGVIPWAGCSKSSVIGSPVGTMTLQVRAVGGTGRFAGGQWSINNIGFQPLDLSQRDVLGGQFLTVTKKAVTFDLSSQAAVVVDTATMTQLSFSITKLTVSSLALGPGSPLANPQTCGDLALSVPPQNAVLDVNTFDPPLTFQVPAGATTVSLEIAVPRLIDAYIGSFTICNAGDLSGYDPALFAQNLSSGVIRVVQSN